mmetsp:Transcript_19905/g.40884  ORF Transcript_19905/g.40884 Transcript_19905/m.40884 type:complete len:517 (+) Transcript_19905:222-1772(+)
MASTSSISEPDSKYRLISSKSQTGTVEWLRNHIGTAVISFAIAGGLSHLGAHIGVCLAIAALPFAPSFFCLAAVVVAQKLFFREPPVEESNRAARRLSSYPQAYPNGWYQLCSSRDLKAGQVLEVGCLGRDFAVFRGRGPSGRVGVLDAHCPHLGANLAVGGVVPPGSDCLRCPFHEWTFNAAGRCTAIPHLPPGKSVPLAANAKAWPVCEFYGMVLFFYHAEREEPSYYPPPSPELDTFAHRGCFDTRVNMHVQEFAENSADFLHFDPLHGKMMVPFTPFTLPLIDIVHRPGWKPGTTTRQPAPPTTSSSGETTHGDEALAAEVATSETKATKVESVKAASFSPSSSSSPPASPPPSSLSSSSPPSSSPWKEVNEGHLSWFSDAASLTLNGKPIPNTAAHADITFIGPGSLVQFTFDTPVGKIIMFQSHLPEAPLRQRVRFTWFADKAMPRLLVWYVVGQWLSQWRNDLVVWENKKFVGRPVLVKGDGPIQAQRRWFKQFYSASSEPSTAAVPSW